MNKRGYLKKEEISAFAELLQKIIFPQYTGIDSNQEGEWFSLRSSFINHLGELLELSGSSDELCMKVIEIAKMNIPHLQTLLWKDVCAAYNGDPAAEDYCEIILSYPGVYAIMIQRFAHLLWTHEVPLLPRILTEYAHSHTGIDIHPGALIGESFFIDHGTGVVIGETAVIGRKVKIYQGVTLGALSTAGGQKLKKRRRHPTVSDCVTIYAGASILGGDTVIGDYSVIGSNVFITKSIPANTKVCLENETIQSYILKANTKDSYQSIG